MAGHLHLCWVAGNTLSDIFRDSLFAVKIFIDFSEN